MPEQGDFPSSCFRGVTDSFGKRKIDPRAMAAARRIGRELELPNSDSSLPSVIFRVAETDPLLSFSAQPVLRRLAVMDGLANNGGTEWVTVLLPVKARQMLEESVEEHIRAWKKFRNDPVRYFSAALVDLYG